MKLIKALAAIFAVVFALNSSVVFAEDHAAPATDHKDMKKEEMKKDDMKKEDKKEEMKKEEMKK